MEKVLKDLLQVGKVRRREYSFNALQDLNNEYGFDFCKPIKAVKFHGTFTINSLNRDYGINTCKQVVAVVFAIGVSNECYRRLEVARIDGSSITLAKHNAFDTLDSVYTKRDFEDYRKGGACDVYVIAQNKEFRRTPKGRYYERKLDLNERYSYYRPDRQEGLIERGSRKIYERKISGYYELDRSGYVIDIIRDNLAQKSRKLRNERAKARYLQMTNTQDMISRARKAIELKKSELSKLLLDCNNADDLEQVIDKISYWNGLKGCYRTLESIERMESKKEFCSPEHFNNYVSEIYDRLNKI